VAKGLPCASARGEDSNRNSMSSGNRYIPIF
jgi:hypothetical protein